MKFNLVNAMTKTVMGLKFRAMPIGLFSETPSFGPAKPIAEHHQTLLSKPAAFSHYTVSERSIGRKETDTIKWRWLVQNLMSGKGGQQPQPPQAHIVFWRTPDSASRAIR